ncbi:unnamed protein product (macronuclear) [Paramecium tetraurelia]|uniref:Transmembrane protein n=1 Tax=Paramecium tetraurelia TaxID=5888 RepID=A0CHM4_PARTE|nr:uncharacterized protein GSPATT00038393001 [Paramecium tetraurelia]CAK70291.1 unnamed protein product [Paramecium tetraurelia]|eukprot:XP_001437688.1 hypothetical protein (macronuclear) [Paramecium tetraurelia strain d4-2]
MKIRSQEKLSNCSKSLNHQISKLKMSTILLIYSFSIFCLSFLILLVCSNVQMNVATNQVQEISEQLLPLQNNRALNIQSKEIIAILNFTFYMITTKMTKLSIINYWSSSIDLKINQEIMPCKVSQQFDDNIQKYFACYSNSEYFQQSKIEDVQFFKLLNLLYINQYTFDFFIVSQQIYLVSFLDNLLTGYYPTKLKNETLEIIQREWFINYMIELKQSEQFQAYKLSPTIRMENYDYLMSAFSMVLFDSKYMVGGIGSLLINLRNIEQFVYVSSLSIILVYDDGLILYTKSYINQGIAKSMMYIYDEEQTGFNISDWDDIKYSINNSAIPVQKYNSLLKCNMYIKASQQPNTPLISLVLTNLTYENEIIAVLDDQIAIILSWFTQTNLYTILIITLIPLKYMFKSTNIVIDKIIRYLNGKFDYKLTYDLLDKTQVSSKNNSLHQLEISYQKLDKILNKSQFKKSELCNILEHFQFEKSENMKLNISFNKLNNFNQTLNLKQFSQLIKYQIEESE